MEKHLKSILAALGRSIPRTHDLPALARLIGRALPSTARLRSDLYLLNQFGVEIRYPGATASPADGRAAVAAMERTVRSCRSRSRGLPRRRRKGTR